MIRTLALAILCVGLLCSGPASRAAEAADCRLNEADLAANARLTFDEFDQKGVTSATARQLGQRKCYAEAARATEHYLMHAASLNTSQIVVLTWHMGQYLASAGDETSAAKAFAASRRSSDDPPQPDGFDWNTYVVGSWAFLVKDKPLLAASSRRLSGLPGVRNQMNAKVLRRLEACFERSYQEAYDSEACEPPP